MRPLISTLAVLLVLSVSGCGDDGERTPEPEPTESSSSASPSEAATATPTEDAALLACGLADEGDVEAAFGQTVPPGSLGGGGHDENGVVWQSDNCSWELEDVLEVTLAVSVAEDFEGGELLCPVLDYLDTESTPAPELGDQPFWVGYAGNEVEGTVRVCAAEVLLDVDVDAPAGSIELDTMRQQTIAFAGVALDGLGERS
jgi:hypothetical protein